MGIQFLALLVAFTISTTAQGAPEPTWEYMGIQTISAYNAYEEGGQITASGKVPVPWEHVATTSAIPFGTVLYIEGVGYVTVEDRGGALIESGARIDLFIDGNPEEWGLQERKVWKVESDNQ